MSDDQAIAAIWLLGALTLVGAALARSRSNANRMIRLALLWAGIILVSWGVAWSVRGLAGDLLR